MKSQVSRPLHCLVVLGTRPEVIKLWPIIRLAQERRQQFRVQVVSTGQHRDLLQAALNWTGLKADIDLDVMVPGQEPAAVAARILERLDPVLERLRPDLVMVQGDTTTAWVGALAAFYRKISVAHVEAGLRSGHRHHPFPEEVHRRMTAILADHHFAPTEAARQALLAEGVDADRILLTGNTVVDALELVRRRTGGRLQDARLAALFQPGRRVILLTTHRRESWGEPLRRAYQGLLAALDQVPDAHIVFPWHPNPAVREAAALLTSHPRVHLLDPPAYPDFVEMLARCHFVITDSGGIQEEAPSLGKPVLVLRERTERMEGVRQGVARLVGWESARVASEVRALLTDPQRYEAMRAAGNPYGDGRAAARILDGLEYAYGLRTEPPEPFRGG